MSTRAISGGSGLFEHAVDDVLERAEPAQHGGRQHAHQRAVAVFQRLQRLRLLFEFVVEGAAAPQHAFKNIGRDLPRGQTGNRCGIREKVRPCAIASHEVTAEASLSVFRA